MRIAVLGYIVRGPIGGMAWHHLQYVMGLLRLGHDVRFVEDSDNYPSCYDPSCHSVGTDPSYGLNFAADAFNGIGAPDSWSYYDAHTGNWYGPASPTIKDFCRTADILLNVSGVTPLREWTANIGTRVLIDTDPVFTQARHLTNASAMERARQHNSFFTFAEGVARQTAALPDDGFNWRATRQPVALDAWTVAPPPPEGAPYTTVMQWESYPSVDLDGKSYGMKSRSFEPYLDLPSGTSVPLEIAMGGSDAPRSLFNENGWRLRDPLTVALRPWDYQDYIRGSRGELSVAKQGYVAANTGWFSERSASYLASGRPVITQDTGFSEWLPTGSGLMSFRNRDEAIRGLAEVESDYGRHAASARTIAEDFFDARAVLSKLVEEATNSNNT